MTSFKNLIIVVILTFLPFSVYSIQKSDLVIVEKSKSKLLLIKNGLVIKEYQVAFGANPKGHKQQRGDKKTPEGKYILDYKKSDSSFYKAIHISYPNEQDIKNAKNLGVSPGGQIMIHGQKNKLSSLAFITQKFNWTNGCIAVRNSEMDEIWSSVNKGTAIEIKP
jgi:murein L,D-transpeptidase YafK